MSRKMLSVFGFSILAGMFFASFASALFGNGIGNVILDLDSGFGDNSSINFMSDLDVELGERGIFIRTEEEGMIEARLNPRDAVLIAQTYSGSECGEECEVELYSESSFDANGERRERVVYNVETRKDVELLGFIDTDIQVETEVDAETGQVVDVDRSWWFFLTSETGVEYD